MSDNTVSSFFENYEVAFGRCYPQFQSLMKHLEHTSICNPQCCTTHGCVSQQVNQLFETFFTQELPLKELDPAVGCLFLHALKCKSKNCRLQHCSEIRNDLLSYHEYLQSDYVAKVVYSETSWFQKDEKVHISVDYQILLKVDIFKGNFSQVTYNWLKKDGVDVANVVKISRLNPLEINTCLKLRGHPHILTSQLVFEIDDRHLMMFAMKADCTLLNYCTEFRNQRHASISYGILAILMQQLLYALVYLHQLGFIHADLKGDNIVLTHGMQQLMLIDFDRVTPCGDIPICMKCHFTTGYAPPEVYEGKVIPSPVLDIYSFGVVVVEMLYGKMAKKRNELKSAEIVRRDSTIVTRTRQDFPIVSSCIELCLSNAPDSRPSAEQLLKQVESWSTQYEATVIPRVEISLLSKSRDISNYFETSMVSYMDNCMNKHLPLNHQNNDVIELQ